VPQYGKIFLQLFQSGKRRAVRTTLGKSIFKCVFKCKVIKKVFARSVAPDEFKFT
jgi:hypothetical protein